MSPHMSFVTLSDGTKMRACLLGGDDPNKPLLIALHGAPGLSSLHEPISGFGYLHEQFRVLVYDARGSGQSDTASLLTDDQWISDIDELRCWARSETFVLAGGSYGGFLALGYALAYPSRLTGLILRDTWACGFRGSLRIIRNILTSPRIIPDHDRQVRLWSGNVQDRDDGAKGLSEILPIYTPEKDGVAHAEETPAFEGADGDFEMQWDVHNFAWSRSVPRFDVRARLQEIRVPTLVVLGRHDPICPVEDSEEIHKGIFGSKLVVFENSGHNPAADEPLKFQRVVEDFLKETIDLRK